MERSKVAVLKTRPETVVEDYRRLVKMAEPHKNMDPGITTILKDNITWHLLYPGVNTTPWQLEGTILGLKDCGFNDLVDVHNHTVVTDPHKGEKNLKYRPVYEKYKIPIKYNFLKTDMVWKAYEPKAEMLVLPRIFPKGIPIPDYFHGKNMVHLPTMKTHTYTVYTGALKNAFGGLLSYRRHYTHTWIHETLVDLLAIQKEIHTGIFCTMDGTTAADGPGPRTVRPHDKNVILASCDQVAADAVAAKAMGFDPLKIPCIRMCHERGLGVGDVREIEIVGEKSILKENWEFRVGMNLATGTGMLLWRSPLKVFQKLLFHTPIVQIFVLASALYHDFVWHPLLGRKVVDRWLSTSPWGRLFQTYGSKGKVPVEREKVPTVSSTMHNHR